MSKSSLDADEKPPTATTETSTVKMEAPPEYPSNQKRVLVMVALYLAIFLVTLVWKIDRRKLLSTQLSSAYCQIQSDR